MASMTDLTKDPADWGARGTPLTAMMGAERRRGKEMPFIHKVKHEARELAASPLQSRFITLTLLHEHSEEPTPSPSEPALIARRREYVPRLPKVMPLLP
ncbi:MAG: hypothetical protein SGPRY_003886 [Prymnesium sp.]